MTYHDDDAVPRAIRALAEAIIPSSTVRLGDAGGTHVESLTEAVMGVTRAIVQQTEILERIAESGMSDEQQRTDDDRRKRINDLAAVYAGQMGATRMAALETAYYCDQVTRTVAWQDHKDNLIAEIREDARALAAAVVDAEEQ